MRSLNQVLCNLSSNKSILCWDFLYGNQVQTELKVSFVINSAIEAMMFVCMFILLQLFLLPYHLDGQEQTTNSGLELTLPHTLIPKTRKKERILIRRKKIMKKVIFIFRILNDHLSPAWRDRWMDGYLAGFISPHSQHIVPKTLQTANAHTNGLTSGYTTPQHTNPKTNTARE